MTVNWCVWLESGRLVFTGSTRVLSKISGGSRSGLRLLEYTCQIQKYWEIWSVALAPSVQEVKNEKRLRLKKSIMKLLNYQISCYGVLPSVGGTIFRPKLYVYLIVSFSSSSFLSTYHPPIYFPGCNILAPRFPNTSEFDK